MASAEPLGFSGMSVGVMLDFGMSVDVCTVVG
jgi:hypothetical protein